MTKNLLGQIDTSIENYIYSIEEIEIPDEEKQVLIEELIYLRLNPVNLNNAEDYSLRLIGLSEFQILSLKRYIIENHPILSIFEIPFINGFTQEDLNRILPFICIKPINWKPPLRIDSIFNKGYHDIRINYKKTLEKSWGYIREDRKGYLGGNFSSNIRYNFNYYDRLSFSLIGDDDAGERFFSNKQTYDFLSTQLTIKDIHFIKQLTIGDYKLSFGQGLSINQSLNFGYFSNDARVIKNFKGIKPNRSITEYNYMRGLATEIKLWDFNLYIFLSNRDIDYSGSILTTGLHRTESEISKKDSNNEKLIGGHLSWQKRGYEYGITGFYYKYKYPIKHLNSPYMKYYFEGIENSILSFNTCIPIFRRGNLLGEFSISENKGMAGIIALDINLEYKTNLSIVYRNYGAKYQNSFSSSIGAQSRNANERGLYIGYSYFFNNNFNFFIGGDYFSFPNISYMASSSVDGYKLRSEINYKYNYYNQFTILAKLNNRPYDEVHINGEKYPEENVLYQIQLRYNNTSLDWISFKTRLGYSKTKTYTSDTNQGMFLSQDIILKPKNYPFELNLRISVFNTDDYDNRFSIYEYSLPLSFYTSQLYDKGFRTYIIINYKIKRKIQLSAKYSLVYYFGKNEIHSGNDKILSNHKQEISIQIYWLLNKYKNQNLRK